MIKKNTKLDRTEINEVLQKGTPARLGGLSFRFLEKERTKFAVIISGIKKATQRNKQKRKLRLATEEALKETSYNKGFFIVFAYKNSENQTTETIKHTIMSALQSH